MTRSVKKMIASALVVAGVSAPAVADPDLIFLESTTTGGNTLYTFQVTSDDLVGSYAVELSFEGTINELLFNGVTPVDTQANANAFNGVLGYDSGEDTWVYSTFGTANPGNNPFTGTETSGYWISGDQTQLFIAFGSSTGLGSPVNLIQIVTGAGQDIAWSGVIAQGGENYNVSGSTVPEPGSLTLLGLGGLALLRRRR